MKSAMRSRWSPSTHGLYDWNLETNAIYFAPGLRIMLGLTCDAFPSPTTGTGASIPATGRIFAAG